MSNLLQSILNFSYEDQTQTQIRSPSAHASPAGLLRSHRGSARQPALSSERRLQGRERDGPEVKTTLAVRWAWTSSSMIRLRC